MEEEEPREPGGADDSDRFAFSRRLPEDCVEYMLFVISGQTGSASHNHGPLADLEAVRKAAMQLATQLTKDYIWQRESFNLQVKSQDGMPSALICFIRPWSWGGKLSANEQE